MWKQIYNTLEEAFPQFTVDEWWGISDPFERMAGSILVQNTTWSNAAKALESLRRHSLLSAGILAGSERESIGEMNRSAGFYRAKSAALISLSRWILQKGGIDKLLNSTEATDVLRGELLKIKGIGTETADTILAYALQRPTISGDAYSRRLYARITSQYLEYDELRRVMLNDFTKTDQLQRLHGLIVEHGKAFCKKKSPDCSNCPLQQECHFAKEYIALKKSPLS